MSPLRLPRLRVRGIATIEILDATELGVPPRDGQAKYCLHVRHGIVLQDKLQAKSLANTIRDQPGIGFKQKGRSSMIHCSPCTHRAINVSTRPECQPLFLHRGQSVERQARRWRHTSPRQGFANVQAPTRSCGQTQARALGRRHAGGENDTTGTLPDLSPT